MASFGIIGHQKRDWEWNFTELYEMIATQTIAFPPILLVNWVSSPLSFFVSASSAAYIYFHCSTYTTTISTLEPRASNAEFHHFILRFNKISLLCRYHWKRGWLSVYNFNVWVTIWNNVMCALQIDGQIPPKVHASRPEVLSWFEVWTYHKGRIAYMMSWFFLLNM
jgi:hypothetical protein